MNLAQMFGCSEREVPANGYDFSYENLDCEGEIIERITEELGTFQTVGEHRREMWEDFWKGHPDTTPLYKNNFVLRINGNYALPIANQYIELEWFTVYTKWLFGKFFKGLDVVEFGCGSCRNLATMALMFPQTKVLGLDWSESSVRIANRLGLNVRGEVFDFFHPNDMDIRGWGVFTAGALEQTGDKFQILLDYIVRMKPAIVVNVEPIYEFYDDTPFDNIAKRYHEARGYPIGIMDYLEKHEIIAKQKTCFGSMYHDYSHVVWRPK